MRLPGTRVPNHHQVLMPTDEVAACQLLHIFWLHMVKSTQVKFLKRLQNRKVCPLYAALPLFLLSGIVSPFPETENKLFQAFPGLVLSFFLIEVAEYRKFQ